MDLLATRRIALRALRANKLRSTLGMPGIIIGVGAVITMIPVGGDAQTHRVTHSVTLRRLFCKAASGTGD